MKLCFLIFSFVFTFINAQTVYKTPSGTKYHLANCRMVKNVSSEISIEKAIKIGLTPCSFCKPPYKTRLGIANFSKKKTSGTNSKNRCHGTTKSGTRCKRYTTIGNDFCFQHLPK